MTLAMVENVPVLVVDDDAALTQTLTDILPLHGFEPFTAPTGQSALKIARRMVPIPAVALVDLRLPDMDGLDLASELHAQSSDLQVVILTGNATLDTAIRALRDQNTDYLLKPVDPDLLIRTLRTAEGRWRLRQAEDELRRTQGLLTAVFEASPLPIVVLAPDLTIRFWNRAAEHTFGKAASEVVGAAATDLSLVPAEEGTWLVQAVLRGESFTGVVVHHRRADGTNLELRLGMAPLASDDREAAGLVAIYEDTTHRRRLEERLQDAQRLDAMGRVAAGVAHDFNNLLSVVLVEAEAGLEDPRLTSPFDEILGSIKATANQGANLTRQLLSFARRQPAEPTVENPNRILEEGARLLARLAGPKVALELALMESLWSTRIDRGQLEQVLSNLVVNARDAMPEGGRLTVATRNVTVTEPGAAADLDQGEWVELAVHDTGTGIPDEVRARIFEPFFTTKARESGTGLGLSTCYGIVERFGGSIAVDSTLGAGTTFRVFLPRAAEPAAARSPAGGQTTAATASILVVDDQAALRSIARAFLTDRGYRVEVARDGAEALAIAASMHPPADLVLVDLHLPDMGGLALLSRLRERQPGLRVLTTLGSLDLDEAKTGLPFLAKPYRLEVLARAIRSLLDQSGSGGGRDASPVAPASGR